MNNMVKYIGVMTLRKKNILSLIFLSFMLVVSVASFFMIRNISAAEYPFEFINIITSIISMLMLAVLFLVIVYGSIEMGQWEFNFSMMIFVEFVGTFCSLATNCFVGDASKNALVFIFTTVSYVTVPIFITLFWTNFKDAVSDSGKWRKIVAMLMMVIASFYILFVLLNIFVRVIFDVKDGVLIYADFSSVAILLLFAIYCVFDVTIIKSKATVTHKISALSYIVLPQIIILLNVLIYLTGRDVQLNSFYDLAVAFALFINFCSVYIENSKKNMQQKIEILESEKQQRELASAIRLSQIKPHFIYNSLAAISSLCKRDAALAKTAIDKFALYLRINLDSTSNDRLIPFEQELEHVENYLWLEKLRFQEELNIEYDIKYKDFMLPPLTVQPIAENAIKHGIRRIEGGGTVKISSEKTEGGCKIIITDNGKGFDVNKIQNDGKVHIGIDNVKKRIADFSGGTVTFDSVEDRGTTVTIFIPEEAQNENNHSR